MREFIQVFALSVLLGFPAGAPGQELQSETPKGAVSGVVRDSGSSTPLAGVAVAAILGGSMRLQATTDSKGAYKLAGLSPGSYRILAYASAEPGSSGWGPSASKWVSIGATTSASVDFVLRARAEVFGTVLEAEKAPVSGVLVTLVGRSYFYGSLVQSYRELAGTDDRGQYRFQNVPPDVPYYILVQKGRQTLDAWSAVPANPKLRKTIIVPGYYSGAPTIEEARAIVLRPGERREIDIAVTRGPSYCVEGEARSAGAPGRLNFAIESGDVSMGEPGGLHFSPMNGSTGEDGRFRVCDLSPGTFKVTAFSGQSSTYGTTSASIVDRDVSKVVVDASPRIRIPGEVVWASAAPATQSAGKLSIGLNPLGRTPLTGEKTNASAQVPGNFEYDAALVGEYRVQVLGIPQGSYVKEVTYGSQSVLGRRLRAGSEVGEVTLRITLATDGGSVTVKAADDKGNPLPDTSICILPSTYASDAQLAAATVIGSTDQDGIWKSEMLAPGKYWVLATDQSLADLFPERVTALRNSLTHATELNVSAGSSQALTVSPVALQ